MDEITQLTFTNYLTIKYINIAEIIKIQHIICSNNIRQ